MSLMRIARETSASPVKMLLKDMGYGGIDIEDMMAEFLDDAPSEVEGDFMKDFLAAAEKQFPGVSADIRATGSDAGGWQAVVHEIDHKMHDPDFVLQDGGSSRAHHPVESALEEAIMSRSTSSEDADFSVTVPYLIGDAKSPEEALDRIKGAPMTSHARQRLRDAIMKDLRDAVPGLGSKNWAYGLNLAFFEAVSNRIKDFEQYMTDEAEVKYRRLALAVKSLIKKYSDLIAAGTYDDDDGDDY